MILESVHCTDSSVQCIVASWHGYCPSNVKPRRIRKITSQKILGGLMDDQVNVPLKGLSHEKVMTIFDVVKKAKDMTSKNGCLFIFNF